MRAAELDLVLVDRADLEVISVLACIGKVNGALGHIAQKVYEGELPAVLVFSVNISALP